MSRLGFRPRIEVLEDRTVPALFRFFAPAPPPPPPVATHFHVIVPQDVESARSFNVVVQALDAKNQVVTNFTGTVQLKLATADSGATLPTSFTFTAADHGVHTVSAKLAASGAQAVSATSGTLTGQAALTVDAPVTHFSVIALGTATAGTPLLVSVTALDAHNNVVPGYTGTVHFTSSDSYAKLPANYAFTAADAGSHIFAVNFTNSGRTYSIAVNDTARGTIVGSVAVAVNLPALALQQQMSAPPGVVNNTFVNPFTSPLINPFAFFAPTGFASNSFSADPTITTTTQSVFIPDPISNISYGYNYFGTTSNNLFGTFAPNQIVR